MRLVKNYAVTAYGLGVLGAITLGSLLNPAYDDGLFGFFYHFLLVPVLGFMFYVPYEIIFSIRNGVTGAEQNFISVLIGLCFCLAVDRFRGWRRGQREGKHRPS